MTDQQLPYNDNDLQCARRIGRARAQGLALTELDDRFIQSLLHYRQQMQDTTPSGDTGKQKVWKNIEATTQPKVEKTLVRRLFSARTIRWAAAAIVIIGALFSFIYLQYWNQPELLAASDATIKTVELNDGSTVTLRPHSKLLAVEKSSTTQLYQLKGEGLFEVTPNKDRTFSVQTENGKVNVLGTRFVLSSWGHRLQVFLEEGSIKVQALQRDSIVVLQPGESASIGINNKIDVTRKADTTTFTDWLDGQLIFNNRPARQVIQELEQQFDISITFPATIADNRLSGQLSLEKVQTALDDLGVALGGQFVKTGNREYRFESR